MGKCCKWIWEWLCNHVRFSCAAVFISGLSFGKKFVENAFIAFLIDYIQHLWDVPSLGKAAALVNGFHGATSFLLVILYFLAVDRIGNFLLLICTIPTLIMGLLSLWLGEKLLAQDKKIRLFYPALLLLTIGVGGFMTAAKSILCDQFCEPNNDQLKNMEETDDEFSKKKKLEDYENTIDIRANVWWYAFVSVGSVLASTFTSNLTWENTFKVSFIVMGASYMFFCSGKRCYNGVEPTKTPFTSRLQEAKSLLRLLILWSTFLVYSLVDAAGDTFFIEQSSRLDDSIDLRIPIHTPVFSSINKIPLSSFYLLKTFTSFAISITSTLAIQTWFSYTESMRKRATFVRLGIGMFLGGGCCMMAWWVEVRRLKYISELGITSADDITGNTKTIPMKILWLGPQFLLLGIVKGLVEKGQSLFFLDHVPMKMRTFESPFNYSVYCVGRFVAAISILVAGRWIRDTLDKSHLDKYLLTLAMFNFFSLFAFIFLFYKYDWNIKEISKETPAAVEDGGEHSDHQQLSM